MSEDTHRTVSLGADNSVTVRDAAILLGMTPATLNSHIREKGAPAVQIGRTGAGNGTRINLKEYLLWREQRVEQKVEERYDDDSDDDEANLKREKTRRERANADRAELELSAIAGRLVDVIDVADIVGENLAGVAASFALLPSRVSTELSVMTDQREIREVLRREVNAILGTITTVEEVNEEAVSRKRRSILKAELLTEVEGRENAAKRLEVEDE